MWIHLNDAFLSVVAHRTDPGVLLVRARVAGDIERVFPGADVVETPTADYRFRAVLPHAVVGAALVSRLSSIKYDNFKNSVAEDDRHDAYADCWLAMRRFQLVSEGVMA
jgi:hypothetical protein